MSPLQKSSRQPLPLLCLSRLSFLILLPLNNDLSRLRNTLTYQAGSQWNTPIGNQMLVHVSYSASPLLKALLGYSSVLIQHLILIASCIGFFPLQERHHPLQQVEQHTPPQQRYHTTYKQKSKCNGWPTSTPQGLRSCLPSTTLTTKSMSCLY